MQDEHAQAEDDLLDTTGHDDADTSATDTSEDEQEQDTLDLGDTQEKGKAEADRQVQAWTAKITAGTKTLEDLPANLRWMKPQIEARLGATKNAIDPEVIESYLEKREREKKLTGLKEELNTFLTKEQKMAVNAKIKVFQSKGLDTLDALEASLEALNLDLKEAELDAKRHAMRAHVPGNYRKSDGGNPSEVHGKEGYGAVKESLSEEKRIEYLKKLRGM